MLFKKKESYIFLSLTEDFKTQVVVGIEAVSDMSLDPPRQPMNYTGGLFSTLKMRKQRVRSLNGFAQGTEGVVAQDGLCGKKALSLLYG